VALGLALGMSVSACFDSDEKFRAAGTTGEPATTTTTDPSTSTGEPPATTVSSGDAEVTCRDLIGCIQQCALSIDINDPEPDLSCITECTEDPRSSEAEVYDLLRLIQCLNGVCIEMGDCEEPMSTSTGTGTGTGTGTSSGGGDEGGVGFLPPCLTCIFILIPNADSEVCAEFHQQCV
jgi:hypothetical protein